MNKEQFLNRKDLRLAAIDGIKKFLGNSKVTRGRGVAGGKGRQDLASDAKIRLDALRLDPCSGCEHLLIARPNDSIPYFRVNCGHPEGSVDLVNEFRLGEDRSCTHASPIVVTENGTVIDHTQL